MKKNTINQVEWYKSDIELLIFYEGMMNKRFVAISTLTGSIGSSFHFFHG